MSHPVPDRHAAAWAMGPLGLLGALCLGSAQLPFILISQQVFAGPLLFATILGWLLASVGAAAVAVTLLAFVRRLPSMLPIVRCLCWILGLTGVAAFLLSLQCSDLLANRARRLLPGDMGLTMQFFWHDLISLVLLGVAGLVLFLIHATTRTRRILTAFGLPPAADEIPSGDRCFENLRVHGQDARYNRSSVISFILHVLVLFGPFFLVFRGCGRVLPPGKTGSDGVPQVTTAVKVLKQEKVITCTSSPIIRKVAELTNSTVLEQVDMVTEKTHERRMGKVGRPGTGSGQSSGYPGGRGDPIRFFRLRYACPGWDDGSDHPGCGHGDSRLLRWIRTIVEMKTAPAGEAITADELDGFQLRFEPPLLFITGESSFYFNTKERSILREYCLKRGGMILADAGSAAWGRCLRQELEILFGPGRLATISDDDLILQYPFTFPHGIDPLTAHDGTRAMGIKENGRWIVFYHPGDLNDGWKEPPQIRSSLVDSTFRLTWNILNYSFLHKYLDERH